MNIGAAKGMLLPVNAQKPHDGLCGIDTDIAGMVRKFLADEVRLPEATRKKRSMKKY